MDYLDDGLQLLAIYRRSYLQQRRRQGDLFDVTPGERAYRSKRAQVLGVRATFHRTDAALARIALEARS